MSNIDVNPENKSIWLPSFFAFLQRASKKSILPDAVIKCSPSSGAFSGS